MNTPKARKKMESDTLYSQLAKAQAEFGIAAENGSNPHFKSSFSELKDLVDASRPALTKYGISVVQYVDMDAEGRVLFVTSLLYKTQSITSKAPVMLKDASNMQEFGKACSYMARYMYRYMVGVVCSNDPDDDDGNYAAQQQLQTLSNVQFAKLWSLIKDDNETKEKLKKGYGIVDLKMIPAKDFDALLKRLENK